MAQAVRMVCDTHHVEWLRAMYGEDCPLCCEQFTNVWAWIKHHKLFWGPLPDGDKQSQEDDDGGCVYNSPLSMDYKD